MQFQPRGTRGGPGLKNARFAEGSCHLVFLGSNEGQLDAYDGPLEDARMEDFNVYQLSSAIYSENDSWRTPPLLRRSLMTELSRALQPGVHWKVQFGTQLVYFGHRYGLSEDIEEDWTSGVVDAMALEKLIDGAKRTSFISLTCKTVGTVLRFLTERIPIESKTVIYTLRATHKAEYGGAQTMYERSANTRDAVLDEEPFVAEGWNDELRCANVIFIPPDQTPEDEEQSLHFRYQAMVPRQSAGISRVLSVQDTDRRLNVTFHDNGESASYVRLEQRVVVSIRGSTHQIHVVHMKEYGATVGQKKQPVRVEMTTVVPEGSEQQRQGALETLLVEAANMCRMLTPLKEQ